MLSKYFTVFLVVFLGTVFLNNFAPALSERITSNRYRQSQRHPNAIFRRLYPEKFRRRALVRSQPVILLPPTFQANENNQVSINVPATSDLAFQANVGNVQLVLSEYMKFLDNQTFTYNNITAGVPARLMVKPKQWYQLYTLAVIMRNFTKRYTVRGMLRGQLIVETDKQIYRPEERVKVRIMYFTQGLRNVSTGNFKVILIAPDGSTVDNREVDSPSRISFARTEVTLPYDAVEGEWTIEAVLLDSSFSDASDPQTKAAAYFTVRQYVLPQFRVQISANPTYVVRGIGMQTVALTILAKYYYGKILTGTVEIRDSSQQQPPRILNITGVLRTTYDLSLVNTSGDSVSIRVSVRDWKTSEMSEAAGVKLAVVDSPYKLSYRGLKPALSPFFPFEILAMYPDGRPAPDVALTVGVAYMREPLAASSGGQNYGKWRTNNTVFPVVTDQSGIAIVTLGDVPTYMSMAIITVRPPVAQLYGEDFSSALTLFVPSLSPDGNSIFLSLLLNKYRFQVNETVTVELQKSGISGPVNYFIICNGIFYDHAEFPASGKIVMQARSEMSPYCVFVAYSFAYGRRYLDAVKMNVELTCGGKLQTESDQYRPGADVTLQFTGMPRGIAALIATDSRLASYNESYSRYSTLFGSVNDSQIFDFLNKQKNDQAFVAASGAVPDGLWIEVDDIARACHALGEVFVGYSKIADTKKCLKLSPTFYHIIDSCGQQVYNACLASPYSVSDAQLSRPSKFRTLTSSPAAANQADVSQSTNIEGEPQLPKTFFDAQIRTDFRETWLFEDVYLGRQGASNISRALPHSITNWTLSSAFWFPDSGLCLAPDVQITAIKDSFMFVSAPETAYVGEQILLKVFVYNVEHSRPRNKRYNYGLCHKIPTNCICSAAPATKNNAATLLPKLSEIGVESDSVTIPMEFTDKALADLDFFLIRNVYERDLSCEIKDSEEVVDAVRKTIAIKTRDVTVNRTLTVIFDADKVVRSDNAIRAANANLEYVEKPSLFAVGGSPIPAVLRINRDDAIAINSLQLSISSELLPIVDREFPGQELAASRAMEHSGDVSRLLWLTDVLQRTFIYQSAIDYLKSPYEGKVVLPKKVLSHLHPLYENLETGLTRLARYANSDGSYSATPKSDQLSLWLTLAATDLICQASRKATGCESLNWIMSKQQTDGAFYFEPDLNSGPLWSDKTEYRQTITAVALIVFSDCEQLAETCGMSGNVDKASDDAVQFLVLQNFGDSDSMLAFASTVYAVSLSNPPKATAMNAKLLRKSTKRNKSPPWWSYEAPTSSLSALQKLWRKLKGFFGKSSDDSSIVQLKETTTNGFAFLCQLRLQNPENLDLERLFGWLQSKWTGNGFEQLMDTWTALRAMTAYAKSSMFASSSNGQSMSNITVSVFCASCPPKELDEIRFSQQNPHPKLLQLNPNVSEYAIVVQGSGKVRATFSTEVVLLSGPEPRSGRSIGNNDSSVESVSVSAKLSDFWLTDPRHGSALLHVCIRFNKTYAELLTSMLLTVESLTQYAPRKDAIDMVSGSAIIVQRELVSSGLLQIGLQNTTPDVDNCLDIVYDDVTEVAKAAAARVELLDIHQVRLAHTYYNTDRQTSLVKKVCNKETSVCKCIEGHCPEDCSNFVWHSEATNITNLHTLFCQPDTFAFLISVSSDPPNDQEKDRSHRRLPTRVEMVFKPAWDSLEIREGSLMDLIQRIDCSCPKISERKQLYLFVGNSRQFTNLTERYGYLTSINDLIQRWNGVDELQLADDERLDQFSLRFWLFNTKEKLLNNDTSFCEKAPEIGAQRSKRHSKGHRPSGS